MSLFKQTWLAIICLMTLAFVGSFVVSSLSAKAYLEQQLYMKNSDNATALALSLSQQDANPVLLELTLAAQFDTGHYELIQLTDPQGKVLILREDKRPIVDAPGWFMNLFPIEVKAGAAEVQQSWQQLGTLSLRSHSRFAYRELWDSCKKLAGYFIAAIILAGLVGSFVLKKILRPLDDVVAQAEAIGNRRFITIEEPSTLEFKAVARSMNNLSERIKKMLHQEAGRLERWRREAHVDKVTGLLNREPFMNLLSSALSREDANSAGVISLLRIGNLAQLNQIHGRKTIDAILGGFGKALTTLTMQNNGWAAGRLNGSDFALLAPRAIMPGETGGEAQQALFEVLREHALADTISLPGASRNYLSGDTFSEVLTALDAALLASDKEGESTIHVAISGSIDMMPERQELEFWTDVLSGAFAKGGFSLASYPVATMAGAKIHQEALIRLQWNDDLIPAGRFLPWISRLELSGELDRKVVELALQLIESTGETVCINLSVSAVSELHFQLWMTEILLKHSDAATKLWMEVQESMAYRYLDNFKSLVTRVKRSGAKVGIEHLGHQLSNIGQLHDIGLDYVKVDAPFVRDINSNVANQTLLRTLCTLVHSIGLTAIAEGVQTPEEWSTLEGLGFDGASGPQVAKMLAS